MSQDSARGYSFLRVYPQHFPQQVHRLWVDGVVGGGVEVEPHFAVIFVDLFELPAFEERLAGEQDVEDDPEGEDIADWFDFHALFEGGDFRGDVAWSAAAIEDIVVRISVGSQSEIDDDWLQTIFAAQHDVLGLDIPVHDPAFVHVVQSLGHAGDELPYFGHGEVASAFVDAGVQLSGG